jgi:hypothetical protein
MFGRASLMCVTLSVLSGALAAPPIIDGCQVLPLDHIFNTRIDDLPVHPQSSAFLQTINTGTRRLHLDLGTSEDMTSNEYYGIPYNIVSGNSLAWQTVHYDQGWPDESDCADAIHGVVRPCINLAGLALLPIPPSPKVEGGISGDSSVDGDHHILVVDSDACILWESYHSTTRAGGGWNILSSAAFDLRSNGLRPATWTSSDAAGFPILPLLLRADEASSGEINHALRFTIQSSKIRSSYNWPATHFTSNGGSSSSKPPMGQLFRLNSGYAIPDNFTVQAKAILGALKRYGMYVADGGSDMFIQGEPSKNWDLTTISQVQTVPHTAFEAVDLAPVMTRAGFSATSAQVPPVAASVVEFYNSNLDHYFITANPGEATAIDNGGAGPGWSRTGNSFKAGGSTSVCRFYGSLSPGPNSHFYTVDPAECAYLKQLQASTPATQKRWNFESLDFQATAPISGSCPAGAMPVYRAYNNGFTRNVDSNHRITNSQTAIQQVVMRGWSNEGVVMCAP